VARRPREWLQSPWRPKPAVARRLAARHPDPVPPSAGAKPNGLVQRLLSSSSPFASRGRRRHTKSRYRRFQLAAQVHYSAGRCSCCFCLTEQRRQGDQSAPAHRVHRSIPPSLETEGVRFRSSGDGLNEREESLEPSTIKHGAMPLRRPTNAPRFASGTWL